MKKLATGLITGLATILVGLCILPANHHKLGDTEERVSSCPKITREFRNVHNPPKHADPELLKAKYGVKYNAPDLIGKVVESELGYYENNKFITPENILPRHIGNKEHIFTSPSSDTSDYYLRVRVRKSKDRDLDIVKTHPDGMKITLPLTKGLSREIIIFPTTESKNGEYYNGFSNPLIFALERGNEDFDGLYKNTKPIGPGENLKENLYQIVGIPIKE